MIDLPVEIIVDICNYLQDMDKISLTATCRDLHKVKNILFYDDIIEYRKIKNSPVKYNFRNLIINDGDDVTDLLNFKCLKYLTFGDNFNQDIKGYIPLTVTHLTFGFYFNQDIKGCIPSSVTHLKFGVRFNKNIKGNIPPSVTHLIFDYFDDNNIKEFIPSTVKYLVFGDYIKRYIQLPITHLSFGSNLNQNKGHIPSEITHLTFRGN